MADERDGRGQLALVAATVGDGLLVGVLLQAQLLQRPLHHLQHETRESSVSAKAVAGWQGMAEPTPQPATRKTRESSVSAKVVAGWQGMAELTPQPATYET